jgi:outer membrane lipoprotein LolB
VILAGRSRPETAGVLLLAAAVLAGCATPGPSETVLSGRLLVRVEGQPERSVSAGFELSGTPERGALALNGPLGTTAAQARWSPGQAMLASGGSETRYHNLDSLASAALGEPVPIVALFDWLRGRAWPGAESRTRTDGAPGFEQLGWVVSLARWSEGWVEAVRAAPPTITVRAKMELAP